MWSQKRKSTNRKSTIDYNSSMKNSSENSGKHPTNNSNSTRTEYTRTRTVENTLFLLFHRFIMHSLRCVCIRWCIAVHTIFTHYSSDASLRMKEATVDAHRRIMKFTDFTLPVIIIN